MKLETGKLDSELLKKIVFGKITYRSEDVSVRPGIGEDCAVMDFGDHDCIMSTDPISSAVSDIGRLAIHITCNDIASNGVQPLGIMLAVMLPEGTTEEDVDHIMGQAAQTAAEVKVEIIGGHTEITPAVKQPVIVSTAIGKALKGVSQSGNDMVPGDFIMMTKAVGLEGSGIIASDYEEQLSSVLSAKELARAKSFLELVSVVPEGIAAGSIGTHGMHDITEGGILGAVWEMCQISHLGAELWLEAIPVSELTKKVCGHFGINWMRLISSGCMMIMVHPEQKEEVIKAIEEEGVSVACIGRVREEAYGRQLLAGGKAEEITPPVSDELYKVVF